MRQVLPGFQRTYDEVRESIDEQDRELVPPMEKFFHRERTELRDTQIRQGVVTYRQERRQQQLISEASGYQQFNLTTVNNPHAARFLYAPLTYRKHRMNSEVFLKSVHSFMGAATTPDICNIHNCDHVPVTPDGDHAYSHVRGMINTRHHDVKDCIVTILQALKRSRVSEFECGREVKLSLLGVVRKPGFTVDSACDFYLQSETTDEQPIIFDVSIRQPKYTGPGCIEATTPLHAAAVGHSEKMKHYGDRYEIDADRIKPLIFETMGGWEPRTVDTLRRIIAAISRGDERVRSSLWTKLQFSIATTLAKAHGKLLLRLDRRMRETLRNTGTLPTTFSSALPAPTARETS
jgi:hypothetical protein